MIWPPGASLYIERNAIGRIRGRKDEINIGFITSVWCNICKGIMIMQENVEFINALLQYNPI